MGVRLVSIYVRHSLPATERGGEVARVGRHGRPPGRELGASRNLLLAINSPGIHESIRMETQPVPPQAIERRHRASVLIEHVG